MSIGSERVKKWRRNTKSKMVLSMGGKCQICGYNKCNDALAFHHLDPLEKEISFAGTRANIKAWKYLVEELRKCILLCHNCHTEYHAGLVKIPIDYQKFNEEFE